MFKIPAAIGTPTTWGGVAYVRHGEEKTTLNDIERNTILASYQYDFTSIAVDGLTIDDLDKEAINFAREKFKEKYKDRDISNEIAMLSDEAFLTKIGLIKDNQITRAAWLLL